MPRDPRCKIEFTSFIQTTGNIPAKIIGSYIYVFDRWKLFYFSTGVHLFIFARIPRFVCKTNRCFLFSKIRSKYFEIQWLAKLFERSLYKEFFFCYERVWRETAIVIILIKSETNLKIYAEVTNAVIRVEMMKYVSKWLINEYSGQLIVEILLQSLWNTLISNISSLINVITMWITFQNRYNIFFII